MAVPKTFHIGQCDICAYVSDDLIKCGYTYPSKKFLRKSHRKCSCFKVLDKRKAG